MDIGSEKCNFGVHLDEDCNKFHYFRKSGIRRFSSTESETQDLLLYRSGLKYKNIQSICIHHEAKLGFAFENRFNKCCVTFKINKKHVKGGQKISTDIAKTFLKKGIECVPGWHKNYKTCLMYAAMRKILSCRQVGVFLQLAMGNLCVGIGGTVNRLKANASLQRPASDQILNVNDVRWKTYSFI